MYRDASEVIRGSLRLLNEDPTHDLKKFLLSRISESENDKLLVDLRSLIVYLMLLEIKKGKMISLLI